VWQYVTRAVSVDIPQFGVSQVVLMTAPGVLFRAVANGLCAGAMKTPRQMEENRQFGRGWYR
jgi:hypothetical protein